MGLLFVDSGLLSTKYIVPPCATAKAKAARGQGA